MKSWTTKSGQRIIQVLGGRSNCYLISYRCKHLLVDAGRKNQWHSLRIRLDRLGLHNDSLSALILTHSHFDHADNAAAIQEKFKTKIIIHKSEADYLASGDNPLVHGTTFVTRFLTNLFAKRLLACWKYKPAEYDIRIDERYDLNHWGFNAYILHTPGHSPGSISVIVDHEIAIVGDAMFGIIKGSVLPPFAEDSKLMVKSWAKLLDTGCSIFLPGHGSQRSRELLRKQSDKYTFDNRKKSP